MYNARKRTRWIGTGFSIGHMVAVLAEMLLIIYVIVGITNSKVDAISYGGGVIGIIALGTIGTINIISMKKWGKTGSSILAGKVSDKTRILGPFSSSLITGVIFGLGFDTATQISSLALPVVASTTIEI